MAIETEQTSDLLHGLVPRRKGDAKQWKRGNASKQTNANSPRRTFETNG